MIYRDTEQTAPRVCILPHGDHSMMTPYFPATIRTRAAAIQWAQQMLRHQRFLVADTETTGIHHGDEIIQLAMLAPSGQVLLDTLVRPGQPIPAVATALHGITNDAVAYAPCFPEVVEQLVQLVAGTDVILWYNAPFDMRLLAQTATLHGVTLPPFPAQCLMRAYAAYRAIPGRAGDWRWHSLSNACAAHAIPLSAHSARDDASAALALLHVIAQEEALACL
jgi:DNA polymerase-3 subunit epsilon